MLALVAAVPRPVWGRDGLQAGEMWNSNSMIAWLVASSGLETGDVRPPARGRAPGWDAGLEVARRGNTASRAHANPPHPLPARSALPGHGPGGG
jgi:hypothetical protein